MSDIKAIKVTYSGGDVPAQDLDIIKEQLIEIVKRLLHDDGCSFEGMIEIEDRAKYYCAVKIEDGQAKAVVASSDLMDGDDDCCIKEQPTDTTLH